MAHEPNLIVYSDERGPRVDVIFPSLPAGAHTLTVVREAPRQTMQVRGAVRKRVSRLASALDFEVPFDVECSYYAIVYNDRDVEIARTGSSSITVGSESPDHARIHNPLDPSTSVLVRFEASAVATRSRHFDGEVLRPQGRRLGVVVSSGRSGYRGLALDVIAETMEQSEKIDDLFGTGRSRLPVLCVRVPKSHYRMRFPPTLMVAVLNPDAVPILTDDAEIWRLTGDEVTPPAPAVVVPILTRDDLDAAYATRDAMDADNVTRFAASRRYDLAGGAG
ncbi:hypothetical protein [Pseudoclavibacter terrae]|uniref:Uncharacterized protein n=1 Tax=Pseudoclavibacter terrae TaxID=1530195 RepID=A0A7J5B964_9MICO|nr:hypothetical protein [Pseudoclavibacter terrae]KAB1639870.1 hypothetical protein F8O03_06055 [Pseudoclavibacter terrae]